MTQYPFGFLNRPRPFGDPSFEIRPIDDFDAVVAGVLDEPTAGKRSFFPPVAVSIEESIPLPVGRFTLPNTHTLVTHSRAYDSEYGAFLVLILGFTLGVRLSPECFGHLWAAPLKERTLVNFYPTDREVLFCLAQATSFWDRYSDARRLMHGAVHWYLVSQTYRSQHERFAWTYTVLDTLHHISSKTFKKYRELFNRRNKGHAGRPKALSQHFGSPLPVTFNDPNEPAGNVLALTRARNELIHEARWSSQPLGYAVSEDSQRMIYELNKSFLEFWMFHVRTEHSLTHARCTDLM